MDNRQIYRRILVFSWRRLLWEILAFLVFAVLGAVGFYAADKFTDKGLIGLAIGLLIGLVILIVLLRYVSYIYKAGQIAMISKAVSEGELPEDVLEEGRRTVRSRFLTVTLFYAATSVIKGIFNQLGRVITNVGNSIGGDTGKGIAGAINTAIQVLVAYLCDCCLGWVFYRKDQNAAKATCEGAVLFFKHGKTLAKNMGRIFGLGLLSFLVIGGIFTAIFYPIFSGFKTAFANLAAEFAQAAANGSTKIPEWFQDPANLVIVSSILAAAILWNILHATFVRPYVLVGVMRNYMVSGMNDIPDEASFKLLDDKSPKFAKLHQEAL